MGKSQSETIRKKIEALTHESGRAEPMLPDDAPEMDLVDREGNSRFWEVAIGYFRVGCTILEAAACLGVDVATLAKRCVLHNGISLVQFRENCMAMGRAKLRSQQYEKAEMGDSQMLIWLGKQELGQVETSRIQKMETQIKDMDDEELLELAKEAAKSLGGVDLFKQILSGKSHGEEEE